MFKCRVIYVCREAEVEPFHLFLSSFTGESRAENVKKLEYLLVRIHMLPLRVFWKAGERNIPVPLSIFFGHGVQALQTDHSSHKMIQASSRWRYVGGSLHMNTSNIKLTDRYFILRDIHILHIGAASHGYFIEFSYHSQFAVFTIESMGTKIQRRINERSISSSLESTFGVFFTGAAFSGFYSISN